MNVCTNQKITLERQKDELESKVTAAQDALDKQTAECNALTEKAKTIGVGFGGIVSQLEDDNSSSWKSAGIEAIMEAEKRNAETTAKMEAGTPELDKLVERITESVNQIRDSKEFQEAAEASKRFAAEAEKKANELKDQAVEKAGELAAQGKLAVEQGIEKVGETVEKVGETARKVSSDAMDAAK